MSRAKLLPGMKVGQYVIRRLMAEGGFGEVYLAEHPLLGRRAAVKVLHDAPDDPHRQQRLLTEARAVNAARHPNVIDVFDFGALADGRAYMAMEYLEGETLFDLLQHGSLDVARATSVLDQVCAALEAAHGVGVIHRDLKPDNIFLARTPQGEVVKVLDFGLAKQAPKPHGTAAQTGLGRLVGTPDYMSPEQCLSAPVSPRSDLYSLGVVAFRMLTGVLPFESDGDIVKVLRQHVEAPPPRPSSLRPMPTWVESLVLRMLEKRPDLRPQSATEVRAALALKGREAKPVAAARVPDSTIPARPRSLVEGTSKTVLSPKLDQHQLETDPVGRMAPGFERTAESTPRNPPAPTLEAPVSLDEQRDTSPSLDTARVTANEPLAEAPLEPPLADPGDTKHDTTSEQRFDVAHTTKARPPKSVWPWVALGAVLALAALLWVMVSVA